MTKRKSTFRFKQFECSHSESSMKIGVDAVLIGAWADVDNAVRILDVGTGCGVIALMCAQRNPSAKIDAIDIDADSIAEASRNFETSPWGDRLSAKLMDFNAIEGEKYDLIISNPPYFNSGIECPDSRRLIARHEASLSPIVILTKGASLITASGKMAMVIPADRLEDIKLAAELASLSITRLCQVKGHIDAPVKRVLVELKKNDGSSEYFPYIESETLILEEAPGVPTSQHRELCGQFYLYF